MKTKIIASLVLGVFALMLLTSAVSATITANPASITFPNQYETVSFTVTNNGGAPIDISIPSTLTITDGKTGAGHTAVISFSPTSIVALGAGATSGVIVASLSPTSDISNFVLGKTFSNSLLISQTGTPTNNVSLPVNFQKIPSEFADNGNLDVSIDTLDVEKGFGEDTSWFPLDEITAKVGVTNNGADKIKSIIVSYGLYDIDAGKWIVKEKESSFSLNDNDDKTLTIDLVLNSLSKFNSDNNNYRFYVWATGEDGEFDNNKTSVVDSESIDMQFENDFVILGNIKLPDFANCGSQAQITADVSNVGSDNQDNVYVEIINVQLGLDEKVQIGDIDSLDSRPLDFTFDVPQNVQEGSYPITILVYDESDDIYTSGFNDDEAQFNIPLKVSGACVFDPQLSISAGSTGGAPGQEMVVKTTVTNTGSVTRTFTVGASGYDTWAELVSFSPKTLTLKSGESAEVDLTFTVNTDALGVKTFSLDLTNENKKVIPQPVEVTISKPGFNLFSGTGSVIGNKNWYVWAIGALNIVLVLIIILVAVRLVKK